MHTWTYKLNCGPVGRLAPGKSARFTMELPVPTVSKAIPAAIGWDCEPNNGTVLDAANYVSELQGLSVSAGVVTRYATRTVRKLGAISAMAMALTLAGWSGSSASAEARAGRLPPLLRPRAALVSLPARLQSQRRLHRNR